MPGHGFSITDSRASNSVPVEDGFPSKGGRRKWFGRVTALLLVALAVLLSCLAPSRLSRLGSLFEAAVRFRQTTAIPALSPAFFGIAGLVGFLLLIALLRSVEILLHSFRETAPPAEQPAKPSDQLPAEAAPTLAEPPSGVRDKTSRSPRTSAPESPNSNSAQRKAIHAVALMSIESRSLRYPETSRPRRRSSDYDGPRRRLTDNRADLPAFEGPYRRTGDLATDRLDTQSSERRSNPGHAGLDRPNPPVVPSLDQQIQEPHARN